MRRLALAALLALAACSVKTEGAACTDTGNCPDGQACGYDGTCSKEAVGCGAAVCQVHQCDGSTLRRCVPVAGTVCASYQDATCTSRQVCDQAAGACICAANRCQASGGSPWCDSSNGNRVTCQQEVGTGCWFDAASSACADPGQVCSSGTCACPANRCEASSGAPLCDVASGSLVTCQQIAGSACWAERLAAPCSDAGQVCSSGVCACAGTPGAAAGELCPNVGAASCISGKLLRCDLVAGSTACSKWVEDDCAGAGLLCDAGVGSCACPPLGAAPFTLFADSTAPRKLGLSPNGAESPAVCRYASLGAAVAAAGSGDMVKATGYVAAPVVFTEGALTVKAGVALTTADAPLTTTHYVIEPAASVGSAAFISLGAGAMLSGFEIRNLGASGVALATSCAGGGDTAAVSIGTVLVTALGTGASPPRFANGLRHSGNCSLSVVGCTFQGAADGGVVVDSPAAATSLTLSGSTIRNNLGTTLFTVSAVDRLAGGLVFKGALPGTVTFRGNSVLSNQGDQIMVFASGSLDLSAPACGTSDTNTLACYTGIGVAVASKAAAVNTAHTSWNNAIPALNKDYVVDTGGSVSGDTQACAAFAGTCP